MRPLCHSVVVALVAVFVPMALAPRSSAAPTTPPTVGSAVVIASTTTAPDGTGNAEMLELDRAVAAALLKVPAEGSARIEQWPLSPAVHGAIVVTRHDIYAADARILTFRNGKEVDLPRSPLVFFWGAVEGDPSARALLWVDPTTMVIEGVSASFDGTFQLLAPARAGASQMFASADSLGHQDGLSPTWACGNTEATSRGLAELEAAARDFVGTTGEVPFSSLQKITVAVDTDGPLMLKKFNNDTTQATNYIAALIAGVTIVYERDLNIRLIQGTTILRPQQAPDPYVQNCNGNACATALTEFSNYWSANYSLAQYPRGLAMMLSGKQPTQGGASGVAWIEGLCSTSYGYSYNQLFTLPYPANNLVSLEAKLVAHELGHNHGSVHTHCTQPGDLNGPIDNCYNGEAANPNFSCFAGLTETCPASATYQGVPNVLGTLMSYCHIRPAGCNSSAVFHPRTIANISSYVASQVCYSPVVSCTLGGGAADTDGDSIPDGVEPAEGRNPCVKDNDIFNIVRLFVMQQYRDFLGREGDSGGITYWSNTITAGTTRASVAKSFFDSPEFQGAIAPVTRLYFAHFNRIPDQAGLDYWIAQYRAGMPLNNISQAFAGSAEFMATYGGLTNEQFVTLVYQNVLGRAPDSAGFTYWTGQLNTASMTRGQVMVGFSESPEYQARSYNWVFVAMTYYGMLRRVPEQNGFDYWVGQLNAGASSLDLINGFLGAPEYRARFLP